MQRELFDSRRPRGFDLALHLRHVCADVVARVPQLAHIDLSRVAISVAQTRKPGPYGLQASLTPLRFEGGARAGKRRGRYYVSQRLTDRQGNELLYILTFAVPRFLDTGFREKLVTIVHELWHISERFDGDLRRHAGRCYAHSSSQRDYDRAVEDLVDRYLTSELDRAVYGFLELTFNQLQQQHGRIFAVRYARPKLVPVTADEAHRLNRTAAP
jgi:predicted metallopeptidase